MPAALGGPSPAALASLSEAARNLVPAQGFQLTLPAPTASPVGTLRRLRPRGSFVLRAGPTAGASPVVTPMTSPAGSAPSPTPTPAAPTPQPSATVSPRAEIMSLPPAGSIAGDILGAAQRYGVSYSWLLGVATCESGLDPLAVNGSSGATGLFQFMPSTFYEHGGTDIWSPAQQANVAAAMFAAGESGQWACA